MNFLKTSFYSGIATFIRLLSGFVINKFIAIFIGPSGLAFIGQFRDYQTILNTFGSAGIQQGIIKYTSEYKEDRVKLIRFISTSFTITLISSLIVSIITVLFYDTIAIKIFDSSKFNYLIIVSAAFLPLMIMNVFFLSVLNGTEEIKLFVKANISTSIFSLILTLILIRFYKLDGALIALAINQALIIFISIFFLNKSKVFKFSFLKINIDKDYMKKLSGYSLMFLISALSLPVVTILIRNYIGENLSFNDAGYWEGITRMSNMSLLVLTTSFSIYLLPVFSKLSLSKLKIELSKVLKIVVVISIIINLLLYLFRDLIIIVLFDESFNEMSELFLFQVIGNIFKMICWVYGTLIIARAKTILFISIQLIYSVLFYFTSLLFLDIYGIIGVTISYMISYMLYLIFLIFYFKQNFKINARKSTS